jgi:multiple sugar transport system permease protein
MLILSITRSLLAFDQFFLLTNGGPDKSTTSVRHARLSHRVLRLQPRRPAALSVLLVALNALQLRVLRKDHTK